MFGKKSRSRRREFLLESTSQRPSSGKRWRNRLLNTIVQLLFLKYIKKLFRASVLGGLCVIIMIGFIAFAVFSPYFHLKKIEIIRNNPQLQIDEIEESLQPFYGINLLLMSYVEIKQTLHDNFPEFRKIEIKEQWPSTLELSIQISPPLFTLHNIETADFAILSDDGVILQDHPDEDLPILKVFQHEKTILPRTKWIPKEELERLQKAAELLESLQLTITEQHLYYAAREAHFITKNQTALWIDLGREVEEQIKKLKFSNEDIGLYTKNLEYVDLRIPKQIFWKAR